MTWSMTLNNSTLPKTDCDGVQQAIDPLYDKFVKYHIGKLGVSNTKHLIVNDYGQHMLKDNPCAERPTAPAPPPRPHQLNTNYRIQHNSCSLSEPNKVHPQGDITYQ